MLVDVVLSKSSSSLASLPIAQRHRKRDVVSEFISSELKTVKFYGLQGASSRTINSVLRSASHPNAKDAARTGTGYTIRHFEVSISLQPQ